MTVGEAAVPEAVLLDAGGVLVLPNPWAIAAVLRAAGGAVEPADVRRLHYAATAAMDATRDRNWSHYNRVFVKHAGIEHSRVDEVAEILESLYVAPAISLWNVVPDGVVEQLRDLAATGVAIAVVSNADGTIETLLRRCEIPFDVVIDSTVVGYAKPEPEIFGFALEKLNIAPENAVHVGDTAWADVDGAHAAGVRPLHLDPFGDCPDPKGHHEHVRSLADVVAIAAGTA
ncbi:MAG: HAD family hydrolase [Acidothermaceae bacterium]